jgi:hypothetical protein
VTSDVVVPVVGVDVDVSAKAGRAAPAIKATDAAETRILFVVIMWYQVTS